MTDIYIQPYIEVYKRFENTLKKSYKIQNKLLLFWGQEFESFVKINTPEEYLTEFVEISNLASLDICSNLFKLKVCRSRFLYIDLNTNIFPCDILNKIFITGRLFYFTDISKEIKCVLHYATTNDLEDFLHYVLDYLESYA